MIKKLFDFLYDNGIDVYFVGQHKGECKSNYVVIKEEGPTSDNGIVGSGLIDLLFFVPADDYLKCEEFKNEVCGLLKEFKDLKNTGNDTGPIFDDDVKGYTFSLMYQIYRKI